MQRFTIIGTALSGAGALFLLLIALFYPIESQFVNNNTASSYVAIAESSRAAASKEFTIVNAKPIPNYQANLGSSYEEVSTKALADANIRADIQNDTSSGAVAGIYTDEPYNVSAQMNKESSTVILNPLPIYDYRLNVVPADSEKMQTQVVAEKSKQEYLAEPQVLPSTGVSSTISSLVSFMLLVSLIFLKAPDRKFAVRFAFKL